MAEDWHVNVHSRCLIPRHKWADSSSNCVRTRDAVSAFEHGTGMLSFGNCIDNSEVIMYFAGIRVNTGGVKTSRFVAGAVGVTILAIGIAVRLNPSSLILLSRDIKNRSPYCSTWKASLDGRIKLRQQSRSGRGHG